MTTASPLPVVVLGRVDPVVTAALSASWRGELRVVRSELTPPEILVEARCVGAVAIITPRSEVAEIAGMLPADVLVLGVSSASFDLLICTGRDVRHLTNPDPATIATLIRAVA